MSDNWIVNNLQNSLNIWNTKLGEIWSLLSTTPQQFKNGSIWSVMVTINNALQGIGLALLVLFFLTGVIKTCGSFAEIKRPEHAFRLFVRFAIAKGIVTYGMDIMISLFEIFQGVSSRIVSTTGITNTGTTVLPDDLIAAIEECSFFDSIPLWAVTLISGLIITVLSFIMIMTVYGRFFKFYMYTAIAPIPLSTFAAETTQNVGISFLKGYCGVCLEGAIIVLACVIFSIFAATPPTVAAGAPAVTQVWNYVGELVFNMLILVGTIKASDHIVKEMMGL